MATVRKCAKCDTEISGFAPEGLCPGCLLVDGFGANEEPTVEVDPAAQVGPAPVPPEESTRFFGDYELLETIAQGGMGIVYKARQVKLDRVVALKTLLLGAQASPESVKRFQVEVLAAASLQHPNIVAIHEVGFREGQHFFTMDFVNGPTLAALAQGKPLPAQRAAKYIQAIAEAIHYAHGRGILHRDLKPSNVLVDENDQPRVTDFGLAKRLESDSGLTLTGQVVGTPSYLPPEQAGGRRQQVGPASDVYALGAILYYLLTGRAPFVGETLETTLGQVQNQQPLPPRLLNGGVPRDLETVCLKCLEKEPSHRYATAQALVDDLERFQRGEPIRARPIGPAGKVWRWCRRKPVVAGLTATSVVLFFLGLAGVLWQWRRAEEQSAQRQQALARSEKERYAANVAVAQNLMEQGQYRQARALLDDPAMLPHQGWEWGWLEANCHRDLMTLSLPVFAWNVAYTPDGKYLLTTGGDGVIRFWDPDSGGLLREFKGHTGSAGFSARAVNPQGTRLVTFGWDNPCTTRIWDFSTGRALLVWTNSALVNCGEFSPDGRYVATAGEDRKVSVWDSSTGELVRQAEYGDNVFTLAFSPDGKRIAFGGGARWFWQGFHDTTVRIWEWQTDRRQVLAGHDKTILAVAFSPDGQTLASSSIGVLRLWDVRTGNARLTLQPARPTDPLFCLAFSPVETNLLAVGGGIHVSPCVQVLDSLSGVPAFHLQGHSQGVRGITFSPDGLRIATTGFEGKVKVWHRHKTKDYISLESHSAAVWAVACSSDGRRVATGSLDQTVGVWDAETGELIRNLATGFPVFSLALSPDGSRLVTPTSKATATLWDLSDGRALRTLTGHAKAVMGVALSPDEHWIATASKDKTAIIWSADQGVPVRTLEGHTNWVLTLAFDADSKRVATSGADSQVIVWEVSTGRRLMTLPGHGAWVQSVVFSPDGRHIATGSSDQHVRLFDSRTGREAWDVKAHDDGVTSISFSPDGERLATAAGSSVMQSTFARDWSVSIWDRQTGYRLFRFEAHLNSVLSVAFSGDGTRLVTGGGDHTARIRTALPWRPESYPGGPADPLPERIEKFKRQRGRVLARHLDAARPASLARTNLQTIIGEVRVPIQPIPKTRPRLSIPARAEDCTAQQIDLAGLYNAALDETWMPVNELKQADLNLGALTPGLHTFGGIGFDVRGVVQLRRKAMDWDWEWLSFPGQVSVPVGRKFSRFHVLHATMCGQGRGSRVGFYRLQYAEGASETLEIILGRDLEDWSWSPVGEGAILSAWEGEDPVNQGRSLRLYARTFVNPHPEREVNAIDFGSALSNAGPFLVALTTD